MKETCYSQVPRHLCERKLTVNQRLQVHPSSTYALRVEFSCGRQRAGLGGVWWSEESILLAVFLAVDYLRLKNHEKAMSIIVCMSEVWVMTSEKGYMKICTWTNFTKQYDGSRCCRINFTVRGSKYWCQCHSEETNPQSVSRYVSKITQNLKAKGGYTWG